MKKLGEGGMGVVYAAQHDRLKSRAVVKVLRREYSHRPEIVARFENEAMTASAIDHKGIVKVMDVGQLGDGSLFILMEFLNGESLGDRLRDRGAMPEQTGVRLLWQAASALGAAHQAGIVHRDLKPDNMFLEPDRLVAGGERLRLLDFGIAKIMEGAENIRTRSSLLMGTPPYMSPEQCRGAGLVDHRTDLYALGIILFEMLCGQRPFQEQHPGDYVIAHLTRPPPSVQALAPHSSARVAAIVARLLAKDPDDRYQSTDRGTGNATR